MGRPSKKACDLLKKLKPLIVSVRVGLPCVTMAVEIVSIPGGGRIEGSPAGTVTVPVAPWPPPSAFPPRNVAFFITATLASDSTTGFDSPVIPEVPANGVRNQE